MALVLHRVQHTLNSDAVAQGLTIKADLACTTGKDYSYPRKNDPTNSK